MLTVGQSNHMGMPACVSREPQLKEGWEQVPNIFSLVGWFSKDGAASET